MTLPTRIEAAEVPTQELFEDAFDLLRPCPSPFPARGFRPGESYLGTPEYRAWGAQYDRFLALLDAEAWTSAAEMLVPEGWGYCVIHPIGAHKDTAELWADPRGHGPLERQHGHAAHPSLALLSAILRALKENPNG